MYSTVRWICVFSLVLMLTRVYVVVASDVCRDLVLYDTPKHNPFRELLPLTHQHPVLLHIIIAMSALHMSNACQKALPCSRLPPAQRSEYYEDALTAKQRALLLLKFAIDNPATLDIDVTLAVVLLFIEFELIDSGKDDWKHHIDGARAITGSFYGPGLCMQTGMSTLRACLISNCMV